ncbi:TrmH family RNA methyltransferase [Prochlorothrix hollandica]|uniref:rRNA methyltransferase n=1 Tax=Prochlorothrix hollandica PCC 9006 = CALU 1027 TaxID=317619 RepID=A0A0M2PTX1_PROHO|nr:RNA methyltransferase [Prochlorothrix hollandica]KKI98582.1 rRNA methyltransferase [Prochlorothrix hollandica PCC 9006 = CALU 1027]
MLTSRQNPLVKQVRQLQGAKGRQAQQQFLLEGTHLLEEALAVNHPLAVVCGTEDWRSRHPDLWQMLEAQTPRLELVSPEVLATMATTVNPDGVLAVAPLGQRSIPQFPLRRAIILETIQDPGNLGTLIRTAVAAGVEGLWLSQDSVDLYHPKVLRASAGQWFRLPMALVPDLATVVQTAQAQGMQAIATAPTAPQTHWQIDWRRPSLVVLGNEGAGLSPTLLAVADHQVRIPLAPGVESLNVAIAAAVLLYEGQRQDHVSDPSA